MTLSWLTSVPVTHGRIADAVTQKPLVHGTCHSSHRGKQLTFTSKGKYPSPIHLSLPLVGCVQVGEGRPFPTCHQAASQSRNREFLWKNKKRKVERLYRQVCLCVWKCSWDCIMHFWPCQINLKFKIQTQNLFTGLVVGWVRLIHRNLIWT